MAEFNRRDLRTWLDQEIQDHRAKTHETTRQFGLAVRNNKLLQQMSDGTSPRLDTVQLILDHIDGI